MKKKISVFVSGTGSNFVTLANAIQDNIVVNCDIHLVIADRKCEAIDRALDRGIPAFVFPRKKLNYHYLDFLLKSENTDFILLAGFLSILKKEFCDNWKRKMINIHPSLLPKFGGKGMYGTKVFEAVLHNKEKKSGVTFHYANEIVDGGEIILQKSFDLEANETIESLRKKTQSLEHTYLIDVIKTL